MLTARALASAQGLNRTGRHRDRDGLASASGSWTYPAELLSACCRAGLLARPVSERFSRDPDLVHHVAMQRANATIAFDVPERLANFTTQALSEHHFFDTSSIGVAASTSR